MSLNERIAKAAQASADKPGTYFVQWAIDHGWKLGLKDRNGKLWAWCAFSASHDVYVASGGKVTLALGKKPARSRFRDGNASVPMLWEDCKALDLLVDVSAPQIGFLVLVEVRGKGKPWPGHPGHIGRAIVGMKTNGAGEVLGVHVREGNYGGRNADVYRPLVGKESARERIFAYIDMEKYEATLSASAAPVAPAPVADEAPLTHDDVDVSDSVAEELLAAGEDVLAVVDWESEPQRCRVVGQTSDGRPLLQPCAPDGQILMDAPADAYPVIGSWDGDE